MEVFDAVAGGGDHAFDLMIFAFGNGHQQGGRIFQNGFGCADGFVVVVQQDAVFQRFTQAVIGRMLQGNAVDFGHFVFRRGNAVVELPVVGNQQNARRIRIQPADRLHVDIAHMVGEKAENAGVLLRFVRGFVIGRLVEQDIKIRHGHDDDVFAVYTQRLDFGGIDVGFGVVVDRIVDFDTVVLNQPLALFAAAYALGLKVFDQLHGNGGNGFQTT